MVYRNQPGPAALDALAGLSSLPYWLDTATRPAAGLAELPDRADLAVVGAGFTGLWAAIEARLREPNRSVVVVEGTRIADGATGRNGGFVSASLTHGLGNGLDRWPDDMPELLRLGHLNLDGIEAFVRDHDIDCDFERTGELDVAVREHEIAALRESVDAGRVLGEDLTFLSGPQVQGRVHTPLALSGMLDRRGVALVDPARLAWGLADVARDLGVVICERSGVDRLVDHGDHIVLETRRGGIAAGQVALATNAYPPLLRRLRHFVVPVYDYVLMTEPLSDEQWSEVGWDGREGMSDAGNQFHYFRVTADGRILWGGYDAVHHSGREFDRAYEADTSCFGHLAEHFFQAFPQLAGLRFTHGWGGAIDTCSRFAAFWGLAMGGKAGYVAGYTGLGVGASRFGAQTMLDLLEGRDTERTRLAMVRTKPVPFPPDPVRSWGIDLTTRAMVRADETGRRNLWLRTLDALGLGFDS